MYLTSTYGRTQRICTLDPLLTPPLSGFVSHALSLSPVPSVSLSMGFFPLRHRHAESPHCHPLKSFYYPASFSSDTTMYPPWEQNSFTETRICLHYVTHFLLINFLLYCNLAFSVHLFLKLLPLHHPLKTLSPKQLPVPECRSPDGSPTQQLPEKHSLIKQTLGPPKCNS